MNRAYSLVTVKAVDEDQRIIEGMASTPTPDRVGDIVEPFGAEFSLPLAFLWQHDSWNPIGHVEMAKPNKNGIPFRARIAKIDEPGELKNTIDRAWQAIKAGLVRGVSIGFRVLEHSVMNDGGWRISKWEWLELSAVTIPANSEATISRIKSIDSALLAASGQEPAESARRDETLPASRGSTKSVKLRRDNHMTTKNVSEQIAALEAMITSKKSVMETLAKKWSDEDRTSDGAEQEEFDTAAQDIEKAEADLARLKQLERLTAKTAKAAIDKKEVDEETGQRRAAVSIKSERLPKGTLFARYAMATAAGKGSLSDTLEFAKRWHNETPEVAQYIKAVAGSTLTDSGEWGNQLVYPANLAAEFVELLRPATIIGRLQGIRAVPFNVRIPVHANGSTVDWVGERAPKPVSENEFDTIVLTSAKIAGIVVLTEELVRYSAPAAEETIRRDLVEQISRFMDAQFLATGVGATANNPASITNSVPDGGVPATGVGADALYADLNEALGTFDETDLTDTGVTFIMRPSLARKIGALRNMLGQFEFAQIGPSGGTLAGYPVLTSNSAPADTIVIVKGDEILMADDGRVTLDASNQATLDMAGSTTPTFSLWQRNCIGLRAERFITWKKRRAEAVQIITGAEYGPVAESA